VRLGGQLQQQAMYLLVGRVVTEVAWAKLLGRWAGLGVPKVRGMQLSDTILSPLAAEVQNPSAGIQPCICQHVLPSTGCSPCHA
jgi:hypothetical protein